MNDSAAKPLAEHLHEFQTQGFTTFPGILDAQWLGEMQEVHSEFRKTNPDSHTIIDVIERAPQLALRAMAIKKILDFGEMLIGPHVQLAGLTYTGFPPVSRAENEGKVNLWHRDMFAVYPIEGVYQRPFLFNAIAYLTGLTDENGPLRVIPGSHMRRMGIAEGQSHAPHPEELLVYPQAGDIVMFHCSLLHSGTPNFSDDIRYFFCMAYNHAWLKYFRADYSGPGAQSIIADARARNDRRVLRLLGIDDLFDARANSGFIVPDEEMWARWCAEDRAALKLPTEI